MAAVDAVVVLLCSMIGCVAEQSNRDEVANSRRVWSSTTLGTVRCGVFWMSRDLRLRISGGCLCQSLLDIPGGATMLCGSTLHM